MARWFPGPRGHMRDRHDGSASVLGRRLASRRWRAALGVIVIVLVAPACGDGGPPASTTSKPTAQATTVAPLVSGLAAPVAHASGRAGGGGGGKAPPPKLPADFPAEVPLPVGTLLGSTGSSPSWSLQLAVSKQNVFDQEVKVVTALYTSRGYVQASNGTLSFTSPAYVVSAIVFNPDHTAPLGTNVAIGVSRR